VSRKKTTVGQEIIEGAQDALRWARGDKKVARVHTITAMNVTKLRRRLKLSQSEFAAKFGLSLDSIQNWEQGYRSPEGPARVLLAVIAKHPEAVTDALRPFRRGN